jgi:hypothetical protein
MPTTRYIFDDIGKVVDSMRPLGINYGQPMVDYLAANAKPENLPLMPYYMYGHRLEIANRLNEKEKDSVFKYQKYPLIALRMDIGESKSYDMIDYSLNLAILNFTEKGYNAEQRMEKVFKPILYPLYKMFLTQLVNCGLFFYSDNLDCPEHTKYDRPYWGVGDSEKNSSLLFSDPLDAIEIIGLKISRIIY